MTPTRKRDYPRIIFMGTPEFAVASLDALVSEGYNVVAVITAPDKPAGRGMKMTESAVKKYAADHEITVLQPARLKDPEFLASLKSIGADLQIVVAFRMLPEVIWNMPPLGTINVHASLLPQYRGAAPIHWAIINGEKSTGITTFKLTHEIDTGNILMQEKTNIDDDETAGGLHDKLKDLGASVLLKTVEGIVSGEIKEHPQQQLIANGQAQLKTAPKIFTETCRISWNRPTAEVYNFIRGLSPFPTAFTELQGRLFKIFQATRLITPVTAEAGKVETDGKTFLRFQCMDGFIYAKEIQAEGKKKMPVQEFLKGYRPNG